MRMKSGTYAVVVNNLASHDQDQRVLVASCCIVTMCMTVCNNECMRMAWQVLPQGG